MYGSIVGREHVVFVLSSLSPRFKVYRRLLREELNPRAVAGVGSETGVVSKTGAREVLEGEAAKFVSALSEKPERFLKLVRM